MQKYKFTIFSISDKFVILTLSNLGKIVNKFLFAIVMSKFDVCIMDTNCQICVYGQVKIFLYPNGHIAMYIDIVVCKYFVSKCTQPDCKL